MRSWSTRQRRGQEFSPATGEPAAWATPEPVTVTWYQHAVAYSEMKWPRLAPHSRANLADALATVTPLLTRETGLRPPPRRLRAALYGYAFNPQQCLRAPDPATASTLAWLERASLPVSQLSDLDYAAAISTMNQQMLGLQAAQQAYAKISQLSLFQYL